MARYIFLQFGYSRRLKMSTETEQNKKYGDPIWDMDNRYRMDHFVDQYGKDKTPFDMVTVNLYIGNDHQVKVAKGYEPDLSLKKDQNGSILWAMQQLGMLDINGPIFAPAKDVRISDDATHRLVIDHSQYNFAVRIVSTFCEHGADAVISGDNHPFIQALLKACEQGGLLEIKLK